MPELMMHWAPPILAGLGGFVLGCLFFGSLWWTVRLAMTGQGGTGAATSQPTPATDRKEGSKTTVGGPGATPAAQPARTLWFAGAGLLRMVLTVAGFFVLGGGDWVRLLACLAGFVIGRWAVRRLTQSWAETAARKPSHAPEP